MPEAPEVHNVLTYLKDQLQDAKIIKATITHPKLAANLPVEEFCRDLEHEHFRGFKRLGKYLLMELDDLDLVAHLRMEGKFLILNSMAEVEALDPIKDRKHIHAMFELSDGRVLCYKDTRKFGRMYLYPKTENWQSLPVFKNVGKDALDPTLTETELYEKARKRKIPVKTFLLDQKAMAGIGNIYADEILYRAGISPLTLANALDLADWKRILDETRSILNQAIEMGGTTIRSFTYGDGHAGSFQNKLAVHGKEDGAKCPHCNQTLIQTRINGRSTWYCPDCQKEK